jgi:predicted HicB family RNase H-like nuclease
MVMKRIINGVTYNTETSTRIARSEWQEPYGTDLEIEHSATLYQTRSGAFFVHETVTTPYYDNDEREWSEKKTQSFDVLSYDQAREWVLQGEMEVFDDSVLELAPEAREEEDEQPEANVFLRMPSSLKRRIEEAARSEKQSTNAWMLRCAERCLDQARATAAAE